jgi:undecaprenyl-diphosphatase
MFEWLKKIDTQLLLTVNSHHSSFFDFIMISASNKLTWIPLYLFLAIILYKKEGPKIWMILLGAAVLILCSDQLSVFIKDHVQRYRPCHTLILQSKLILINGTCGGQFGFVSSHASNSFALASLLFFITKRKLKWLNVVMLSWMLLISYSRVYLGAHYPSDVLGGWITGFILSTILFYFYRKLAPGSIHSKS